MTFDPVGPGRWEPGLNLVRDTHDVTANNRLVTSFGRCNNDWGIVNSIHRAVHYVLKYCTKAEKSSKAAKDVGSLTKCVPEIRGCVGKMSLKLHISEHFSREMIYSEIC